MDGGGGGDRPQHVDGALVHQGFDRRQVGGAQAMFAHHVLQGVGRRVGVAARGVVFERGLGQGPALAQAVEQPAGVGVAGHAGGQALRALEDALRAGEAVLRQVGRRDARGGGVRGVQLLGVRGIAQELPQAGRLRARRAQGMQHLRGVEPQQMADRDGGGQGADRGGGMEDPVVRTAEEFADADAGLIAGHRRGQQVAAAAAKRLRDRQRRREYHRRGWNTAPLCTSSCSTTWQAAALTMAANSGVVPVRVTRFWEGPSAGPMAAA